ncbi:MAG: hypothetical protein CL706_07135 [Chloroflexi bacterium]|nr:hypothetical protein [Chloroflexota bacterium]
MKWEKTINPVRSIGPSKAHDLLFGCPLSVVIGSKSNRENCPESVPSNRKAIIGTIKHGLQERAISSKWEEEVGEWSIEEANSIFEYLTEKEEDKLKNDKLNSHLIPISHEKNFTIEKFKCVKIAVDKRRKFISRYTNKKKSYPSKKDKIRIFGSEVPVWDIQKEPKKILKPQDDEYKLYGKIDFVEFNKEGIIIGDIKTGKIHTGDGVITKNFVTQLQLYKAMWILTAQHMSGKKMNEQEISTVLEQDKSRESIDTSKYMEKLQNVREKVNHVNEIISKNNKVGNVTSKLAKPSLENCRFCSRRPGCTSYSDFLGTEIPLDKRNDLKGIIISKPVKINHSLNKYQFRLRNNDNTVWIVDNIDSDRIEIEKIQVGRTISVYSGKSIIEENNPRINFRFKCYDSSIAYLE